MPHSTNQLRKHLKFTLLHKIRQFTLRRKIDTLGENVFIEKNVKILRFPKNVQIGNQVVLKEEQEYAAVTKMPKLILVKTPHLDIIVFYSVLNP